MCISFHTSTLSSAFFCDSYFFWYSSNLVSKDSSPFASNFFFRATSSFFNFVSSNKSNHSNSKFQYFFMIAIAYTHSGNWNPLDRLWIIKKINKPKTRTCKMCIYWKKRILLFKIFKFHLQGKAVSHSYRMSYESYFLKHHNIYH